MNKNNMSQEELNELLIFSLRSEAEPPAIKELLRRGAQAEFLWKNSFTEKEETPLMVAMAHTKFFSVIEMLVENEGRLDTSDVDGNTPIFFAMSNNNLTIAKKAVLKLGANANHQNKKGETPLMIGAETVNVLSDAKDFINWGFDFTTYDIDGKDAFIHALENGRGDNSQSIIAFFAQQCETL